ncbi:MAG TPA: hypothetical protein VMW27_04040 [Thermoanaerobaculia bacterium]|nr:hypothetical protein [Thermoanaerobaculia bacterium]
MKRSFFRIGPALAGALLFPTLIAAQGRSSVPQKPAPRGPFEVRLLATLEPNQVFKPSSGPDGKMRPAAPATVVPRGKKVTAVLFLKDCAPDAAGKCNVDVDLQGFTPSGQLFKNERGAELWKNKKAPAPGIAQLGSQVMNIQLEQGDATGVYRIVAVAHDRVAGVDKKVETSFEVK